MGKGGNRRKSQQMTLKEMVIEITGGKTVGHPGRPEDRVSAASGAADGAEWSPQDVAPGGTGDGVKSSSVQWVTLWFYFMSPSSSNML